MAKFRGIQIRDGAITSTHLVTGIAVNGITLSGSAASQYTFSVLNSLGLAGVSGSYNLDSFLTKSGGTVSGSVTVTGSITVSGGFVVPSGTTLLIGPALSGSDLIQALSGIDVGVTVGRLIELTNASTISGHTHTTASLNLKEEHMLTKVATSGSDSITLNFGTASTLSLPTGNGSVSSDIEAFINGQLLEYNVSTGFSLTGSLVQFHNSISGDHLAVIWRATGTASQSSSSGTTIGSGTSSGSGESAGNQANFSGSTSASGTTIGSGTSSGGESAGNQANVSGSTSGSNVSLSSGTTSTGTSGTTMYIVSGSSAAPDSVVITSAGTASWGSVAGASSYQYQAGTSSSTGSTWTSTLSTTAYVDFSSYNVGQTIYFFVRVSGSSSYSYNSVVKQASAGAGNSGPIFSNGVPDQTAVVGVAYSYTIPANAATDAEGDAITYSVSNPPAWSSYNSSTRVLSGTPVATGVSSFTVVATDSNGAQNSITVQMTVTANQSPTITNAAANQSVSGGASFSYTLPNDHASDPEGGVLTYSASGMPNWMSFNSGTKTFSGSAPNSSATSTITVTVTDAAGNTSADEFDVIVSVVAVQNLAPVINSPVPNQTVSGGAMFEYALPDGYASDPENGPLTYSASNMPAWLSFNTVTRVFTGNAPSSSATSAVTITVQDAQGNSTQDEFNLIVQVNSSPVIANPIPDQSVAANGSFSYTISGSHATDSDGNTLSYSASGLPAWASFNSSTKAFSGTAPSSAGSSSVTVTVSDGQGGTATDVFTLTVTAAAGGGGAGGSGSTAPTLRLNEAIGCYTQSTPSSSSGFFAFTGSNVTNPDSSRTVSNSNFYYFSGENFAGYLEFGLAYELNLNSNTNVGVQVISSSGSVSPQVTTVGGSTRLVLLLTKNPGMYSVSLKLTGDNSSQSITYSFSGEVTDEWPGNPPENW